MSLVKKASGSNKKARKKKVKKYSRKASPGKNGARGKKTAPKAKKGRKFPLKVTITFPDLFPHDFFDFGILGSFFRRFTKGLEVSCTSGQNSERNSKKRKKSKKGKNKSDRMFCGLFKNKKKSQAKKKAPGKRVTTKSK